MGTRILFILVSVFVLVIATDETRIYDKDWNEKYRIRQDSQNRDYYRVYDKDYNEQYKIYRDRIYDKDWNEQDRLRKEDRYRESDRHEHR